MSTKTTFKRVALVTVAALGFGVMSVVPSSAAINADSLTLSAVTAAQTTAETQTATSAVATVTFLGAASDSIAVTASLVSAPAGNTALPVLALTETASAFIDAVSGDKPKGYTVAANTGAKVVAGDAAKVTTAKFAVFIAGGATTGNTGAAAATAPAVAGTYVVKLTPTAQGANALAASAAQTLTITVTTASSQSKVASAASTVYLASGETTTTKALKTDDSVIASKALATKAVASILVTQNSATDVATAGDGESITATITGSGILAPASATNSNATTFTSAGAKGRTVIVAKGERVGVYADGASGVGTITITTAAGLLLATKTVTFFDTKPATVTAVVKKAFIKGDTANVEKVLAITVKDSAGNPVTDSVITAAATDTTTTVGGAATCLTYNSTDKVYYCGIAGKSAKYGKVNYTVTATGSDLAATAVTTTADVTFSSVVATKITITGPATGTPGEEVTYTLTATDTNGYAIADTTYGASGAGGALFASAVTSGWSPAPFLTTESWTSVSGVITTKGVLPIAGKATATWTLIGDGITSSGAVDKSIGKTDIVVSTEVSNPGVDAAAAAAEEATAAANDATDAALSAAEAAEAATAMAQEAVDAVAELSASVTKLISALRAQITSLTNLVIKIQKKVKA
jgi:hypothetical protein